VTVAPEKAEPFAFRLIWNPLAPDPQGGVR
jgi:hypothetical protein